LSHRKERDILAKKEKKRKERDIYVHVTAVESKMQ